MICKTISKNKSTWWAMSMGIQKVSQHNVSRELLISVSECNKSKAIELIMAIPLSHRKAWKCIWSHGRNDMYDCIWLCMYTLLIPISCYCMLGCLSWVEATTVTQILSHISNDTASSVYATPQLRLHPFVQHSACVQWWHSSPSVDFVGPGWLAWVQFSWHALLAWSTFVSTAPFIRHSIHRMGPDTCQNHYLNFGDANPFWSHMASCDNDATMSHPCTLLADPLPGEPGTWGSQPSFFSIYFYLIAC